jgi:SUKH-3 immunity protein
MSARFSDPVVEALRKAGWYEGRLISSSDISPSELTLFPAAEKVISEFGELHIGESGPGIDFATSDVNIDPRLGAHLWHDLNDIGSARRTRLYPLGEVHLGHGLLIIDEQGRIYLWADDLERFAGSFSQALEMLVLGKRSSAV